MCVYQLSLLSLSWLSSYIPSIIMYGLRLFFKKDVSFNNAKNILFAIGANLGKCMP